MLRDITIGKYYNISSFVHSLDPRCKIIALVVFMVLIFAVKTPFEYLLMALVTFFVVLLSRVPFSYIVRGLKPVWLLVLFTGVINLFFGGGENVLFKWWVFKITEESVFLAISMLVRIVLLIVMSSLLTLTTSPMELTGGIEKLLKPLEKIKFPAHEIAMMMSIALRFIPTLTSEAEKIVKAQKARGNDIDEGSIVKKAKAMVPLMVPLFISAFRRADDLAIAMEARCYNGSANRTSFRAFSYKKGDKLAFLCIFLITVILIICRVVGV